MIGHRQYISETTGCEFQSISDKGLDDTDKHNLRGH